jgi:hypothetical protein
MVSLLISAVAVFGSSAQNADYIYTNNNGTITITHYIGSGGAVTIPSSIDGLPVTSIGISAFMGSKVATSVTIPDSVTSIGQQAFYSCSQLTNATFPQSLVSIGGEAFRASGLSTVAIPSSVTNLGAAAFVYCDRLTAITVDALNPNYSSVEGVLFNKSHSTILGYPGGRTGSYQIPETVNLIGERAFGSCGNLTSVTIPDGVTWIGLGAFFGCTSLQNISIPVSVRTIDLSAFAGCASLTSVTIPHSITTIENYAFSSCTNLTNVIIPKSVTRIGDYAFSDCTRLPSVSVPNSVTTIGAWAFSYCTSLTGVYFEGSASIADSSVFNGTAATVYYLPGTTGWGTEFAGRLTAPWVRPNPIILTTDPSFGIQANQFGFIISWATNASVVVEASTTLANPTWFPVSTNTLVGGSSYFGDTEWTNYPSRFYRIRPM